MYLLVVEPDEMLTAGKKIHNYEKLESSLGIDMIYLTATAFVFPPSECDCTLCKIICKQMFLSFLASAMT